MSIYSAMLAGVSGLSANSSAMATISDNISNISTTGYKASRSDFEDLVNAQNAKTTYNAGGTSASTRQLVTAQGNIASTSVSTDLAISGDGFFVVSPSTQIGQTTEDVGYTRNGTFEANANGYLVNGAGNVLKGWTLDSSGNPTGNTLNPSALTDINVNGISDTSTPTSTVYLQGNLNSSQTVSTAATAASTGAAGAYNAATNNMASGSVTPDATWQYQIVDSLGGTQTFNVGLLKSATTNQWYAEVYASPSSNITSGSPLANGQIATGTLAFNSDGTLDKTNTSSSLLSSISIGGYGTTPAAGAVSWANSTGLGSQTISLDIGQNTNSKGAITQYNKSTALNKSSSDGSTAGSLKSLSIDKDGYLSANFTSGQTKKLFQIPIATFSNSDGLQSNSGGFYTVTSQSGTPNIKEAGTAGAGTIQSSSLEASTTDLAKQFSDMIMTQRAYSAASKIITTADDMLNEVISMKR